MMSIKRVATVVHDAMCGTDVLTVSSKHRLVTQRTRPAAASRRLIRSVVGTRFRPTVIRRRPTVIRRRPTVVDSRRSTVAFVLRNVLRLGHTVVPTCNE